MRYYAEGDILKNEYTDISKYYLVTKVAHGSDNLVESVDVILFYPVEENLVIERLDVHKANKLAFLTTVNVDRGENMMKNVNKRRRDMGFEEIPKLDELAVLSEDMGDKGELKRKVLGQVQDIIRYDRLKTVDECLDALNDLSDLHRVFGDEAYLQIKEMVYERLEILKERKTYKNKKGR